MSENESYIHNQNLACDREIHISPVMAVMTGFMDDLTDQAQLTQSQIKKIDTAPSSISLHHSIDAGSVTIVEAILPQIQ